MGELKVKTLMAIRDDLDSPWEKAFRPKRRSDIRTREVEGETVVIDRRDDYVHEFNKTASYIWERCNGLYTPDEITCELCEVFEVDYRTALKDVLATVEKLQQSKLLEDS